MKPILTAAGIAAAVSTVTLWLVGDDLAALLPINLAVVGILAAVVAYIRLRSMDSGPQP